MISSTRDAALILIGERGEMNAEAIAARINLEERFQPIRDRWDGRPIERDQVYAAMSGLRSKTRNERNYIQPVTGRVGAHQRYQLTSYGEKLLRSMAVKAPDKVQTPDIEHVDHPAHYGGSSNLYEAIKVIEAWGLDFCLGNTVKYISRAGKKGRIGQLRDKEVEDLRKARWYLNRRIEQLDGMPPDGRKQRLT